MGRTSRWSDLLIWQAEIYEPLLQQRPLLMDPVIPWANPADPKVRCLITRPAGGGRKDKSTLDVFGGGYIRETDWGLAIWVVDHWLMKFHFSAVWLLLLPAFWDFWLSHMTYIESKCTPSMILGHLDNVQPLSQNALPWEIYHTQVFDASELMRNARLGWARYL